MWFLLNSIVWLILGLAGLLVIVAYDRWEHRRRHAGSRASDLPRGGLSHLFG